DIESHVVGQAAEESHGDVSVAIDESGQNQFSASVDTLLCGHPVREKRGFSKGDEGIAANRDFAVLEDLAGGVHRDDGAAGDKQVHRLSLLWRFRRSLGERANGTGKK